MKLWEILKSIWKDVNAMATVKTLGILIGSTIISILITYEFFDLLFPEFTQGLAVRITRVSMFLALSWAWDRFAVPEVNTIEELKKGNIAYAIFISSFTIGLAVVCASI